VPSCGHFELVQDQEGKKQLVGAMTGMCELLQLFRSREEFANEKS
jgi:hypothetical protein